MNNGQFISQSSAYRSAANAPKTNVRRKTRSRRLMRKAWPTR